MERRGMAVCGLLFPGFFVKNKNLFATIYILTLTSIRIRIKIQYESVLKKRRTK